KPYYKHLSQNHNVDMHINKNYFLYHDIIPLNDEEKIRLDETYKAYLLGLIFGVFDVIPENDSSKAIYKYTKQEGITVKRVEQLGIESRLVNRLFEEQGKDALRYRILKDAEAVQSSFFKADRLSEMLSIYEYYYDVIYKPQEFEISGHAKTKIETYQFKILRSLAKEIEDKISLSEKAEFTERVIFLKNNPNEISFLVGDGEKRALKVNELLNTPSDKTNSPSNTENGNTDRSVSMKKLREFKEALDDGLISSEEYEKAKKDFLKL
ncbi:MAG TPA: hypothetical protein PKD83_11115, partial [Ignavibacteria bacterium]|nr:hypothetical protein [Ignavibacteria bacterium]